MILNQVTQVSNETKEMAADLAMTRMLARDLIDTCRLPSDSPNSAHLTASVAQLDADWSELKAARSGREREVGARVERMGKWEGLRKAVGEGLEGMRGKVEELASPGVELSVLRQQEEELNVRILCVITI